MSATLDEHSSDEWGRPLESLEVTADQEAPTNAYVLPSGSLSALWSVRDRGLVGGAKRNTEQGIALRTSGLTGKFGAPTAAGVTLTGVIAHAGYRLVAERRSAEGTATWSLWARRDLSVTLVREDGQEKLDVIPFSTAVARLVGWLGISPYWPVPEGDEPGAHVIGDADIDARIRGDFVEVPSWAAESLARRWRGTWSSASVGVPDSDDGLPLVIMDGNIHVRDRVEGGSLLSVVPSYWAYSAIFDLIGRTGTRR
ncbi:hypothetical protein [Clavibacter sp. Sh2126]|uniref:hypothetical protein n=1 Tax=Clavibacter sp. Sh2126 TaxID=3397678 RepID=UPI0039E1DE40